MLYIWYPSWSPNSLHKMLFHRTFYIATKLMDIIKIRTLEIVFFSGVRVTRSLVLCVCFVAHCLSRCTFFFWPLWCLFFALRILITPLVFSNSFFSFIVCHAHVNYTLNYKIIFKFKSYKICYSIFKKKMAILNTDQQNKIFWIPFPIYNVILQSWSLLFSLMKASFSPNMWKRTYLYNLYLQ